MFEKVRMFAARALFALVVATSLGLGLLIAGVAAVLGILMVAAFHIAMIGAGRQARKGSVDQEPSRPAEPDPVAQPA